METKLETAKENLAYAKANFESARDMIEALRLMGAQINGELIGARHQTGRNLSRFLFATGVIALAYAGLTQGQQKVQQFLAQDTEGFRIMLTDGLYHNSCEVAVLIGKYEKILQYASSTNLPEPYRSDGIDITKMAEDVVSLSNCVDYIIGTITELIAP